MLLTRKDSIDRRISIFSISIYLGMFILLLSCQTEESISREQSFNTGWKFSLNANDESYEIDADDSKWRTLNLPHDWSVESPFDSVNGEGCTAYLPGGIGWYRKHFTVDTNPEQLVYNQNGRFSGDFIGISFSDQGIRSKSR